jgi:two-component system, OmpR family, phosphate regulon response regulator PhoB
MAPPIGVASSVLIADDDADICALVATILTRAGFHASTVGGGVPALAAARRERAQLYVLDVRMPDMSGLDVCRELKADEATSGPVLLISAESSRDDVAAGFAAGCDDYLPKPFSSSELIRRVDQLLARADQP